MSKRTKSMAVRRRREAYCFILPAFFYMILVLGYPLAYNIILSFKNVNVKNLTKGGAIFVGWKNYIDLFQNPTFLLVLKNTFIFTIACPVYNRICICFIF